MNYYRFERGRIVTGVVTYMDSLYYGLHILNNLVW